MKLKKSDIVWVIFDLGYILSYSVGMLTGNSSFQTATIVYFLFRVGLLGYLSQSNVEKAEIIGFAVGLFAVMAEVRILTIFVLAWAVAKSQSDNFRIERLTGGRTFWSYKVLTVILPMVCMVWCYGLAITEKYNSILGTDNSWSYGSAIHMGYELFIHTLGIISAVWLIKPLTRNYILLGILDE